MIVAFPAMMAAGAVAAVLCYGIKALLVVAVPVIAGALLIGWALGAVGVPVWIATALLSVGIGVLVTRLDRGLGRGSTVGLE
jgi:hypothetical protein